VTVVEFGLGALAALAVDGRGRVVAVYRRAAYLQVPGGLVALTTADVWRGPLHVRSPVAPDRLAPGDVVDVVGGCHVRIGRVGVVDLADASVWRGALPDLAPAEPVTLTAPRGRFVSPGGGPYRTGDTYSPERALSVTGSASAANRWNASAADVFAAAPPPALVTDERFAGRLEVALHRLRKADLAGVARAIGGLGPGLTPAGDDTLAGILLVARAVGGEAAEDGLVAVARGVATTSIARAFLEWAARGQTVEPAHDLLAALAAGDPATAAVHLCALARLGHTSGADLAYGLHLGLENGNAWHGRSLRGTTHVDRSAGLEVGPEQVAHVVP